MLFLAGGPDRARGIARLRLVPAGRLADGGDGRDPGPARLVAAPGQHPPPAERRGVEDRQRQQGVK